MWFFSLQLWLLTIIHSPSFRVSNSYLAQCLIHSLIEQMPVVSIPWGVHGLMATDSSRILLWECGRTKVSNFCFSTPLWPMLTAYSLMESSNIQNLSYGNPQHALYTLRYTLYVYFIRYSQNPFIFSFPYHSLRCLVWCHPLHINIQLPQHHFVEKIIFKLTSYHVENQLVVNMRFYLSTHNCFPLILTTLFGLL